MEIYIDIAISLYITSTSASSIISAKRQWLRGPVAWTLSLLTLPCDPQGYQPSCPRQTVATDSSQHTAHTAHVHCTSRFYRHATSRTSPGSIPSALQLSASWRVFTAAPQQPPAPLPPPSCNANPPTGPPGKAQLIFPIRRPVAVGSLPTDDPSSFPSDQSVCSSSS